MDKINPAYIQISGIQLLPFDKIAELRTKGVGIIYANIDADHDCDPSWILGKYKNKKLLDIFLYQINLLGNIENSWEFFKSECPKYPNELQILDITKIGEQFPLMISLDFNEDNIVEIMASFPSIQGINFSLSEKFKRKYRHYFKYNELLSILKFIKKK